MSFPSLFLVCAFASIPAAVCDLATQQPESPYSYRATWEPTSHIWLAWPTFENVIGYPSESVLAEIIAALHGHCRARILINKQSDAAIVASYLNGLDVRTNHVDFMVVEHVDIWMRDNGPIFMTRADLNPPYRLANFSNNAWGYENYTKQTEWQVDARIHDGVASAMGITQVRTGFHSEGGDRSFNGAGALIVSKEVEFQRNPSMTQAELEDGFKRVFGVQQVLWMENGLANDESTFRGPIPGSNGTIFSGVGTGGHTDHYVRFVSSSTVLLAEVTVEEAASSPILAASRERLERNRAIIEAARDLEGNPFRVVRIPTAPLMFHDITPRDAEYQFISGLKFLDGTRFKPGQNITVSLTSSYVNAVTANSVILISKYYRPGISPGWVQAKDDAARAVWSALFPERTVVTIDPSNINMAGGGLHCVTCHQPLLQQPDGNSRAIWL